MRYCGTARNLCQHYRIRGGVDQTTILIKISNVPIEQSSRTNGSYLCDRKLNGWVWSGSHVWRCNQPRVQKRERGGDAHRIRLACDRICITIDSFIPNIFWSELQPGRLLKLYAVTSRLNMEAIIAVAVSGRLLQGGTICI